MVERITLYSAHICPYAHRAELALKESGLDYKRFEIDLQNKPEWYAPKVNPASKVPAIAYGGPDVDPATPSPESTKLAESLVLIEFVNDLLTGTDKSLLPADPVGRARARFFVETFQSKFGPAWVGALFKGEDPVALLPAFDVLIDLLPADEGSYAVGKEWSLADAAVTPFIARALTSLKHDIGAYDQGLGKAVYQTIQTDPKYERLRKYYALVSSRESFKSTWFEDIIVETFKKRTEAARAERASKKA